MDTPQKPTVNRQSSPINRKCDKCDSQELTIVSTDVFRHNIAALKPFIQIKINYVCPNCGQKSGIERVLIDTGQFPPRAAGDNDTRIGEVKRQQAAFSGIYTQGQRNIFFQYPAVSRDGENILFPTSEGNVQDGTVINQYGDPDLAMKFAEEYFRLFRLIMPNGRLPHNLVEIMPALHLLVTTTELAIKSFLIRDDRSIDFKSSGLRHSLQNLYDNLDDRHRNEIEQRFRNEEPNLNLSALGVELPTVKTILSVYDATYGGESSVYMDSRFYAEPTTMFRQSSSLHGANLVKAHTPYPIFLPVVAHALIDTYWFFSGHERLKRLGAELDFGSREPGKGNHGEWGLTPSSMSLVVLSVPQPAGIDAKGKKLKAFNKLLSKHPPGFRTNWMYGGNTLLFYDSAGREYVDGKWMLNGVECRTWFNKRLGLHTRDLYLLANALESGASFGCLAEQTPTNYEWMQVEEKGAIST